MPYYFDIDGVLANFHKEPYKYENASSREWIAHLDPFMENVRLVNRLIRNGEKVYILSKAATDSAKEGKFDWLGRYIPMLAKDQIIIIVGNGRKVDYIREDGILVDDDLKNIRPWIKAGHKAIHVEVRGSTIIL